MAQEFLKLSPERMQTAFDQAALRRSSNPVIIEKDFWVSFMLRILFNNELLQNEIVFKGGTSLSKVFGVIDRFSEDIDLSVSPGFLGFSEDDLEKISTRTQRDKRVKELEARCMMIIRERVQPILAEAVTHELGDAGTSRLESAADERTQCPVILFHYPTRVTDGFPYLRRSVKLEFGSLTDQQPKGKHTVKPWIADDFPQLFHDWDCTVTALEIERSFWEKATILHAEFHRPKEKDIPSRFSRHYSDVAALARSPLLGQALLRTDLCERVGNWKNRFFSSSWAHYDTAKPGTFHLVPPDFRLPELRRDYEEMRDMFMSRPLSFDEVLVWLERLEKQINAGG
jgi:Nucleotidyl transferase AbiEii toxin, Type IV TA system